MAPGTDDLEPPGTPNTLALTDGEGQLAYASVSSRLAGLRHEAVPMGGLTWLRRQAPLTSSHSEGREATALSTEFIHFHDPVSERSVSFYRSWVMEVDNLLVSAAGTGMLLPLEYNQTLSPSDLSFEDLPKFQNSRKKNLI